MREKELRLAIVLTGGVSLAVFMHGVSRELLKLIRASKAFHGIKDIDSRAAARYGDVNGDRRRETDSEEIYFELLQAISRHEDLRVVIDVIAGASAGGVNGIMLARALAHDLPLDAHRAMWLQHADAIDLMDERTSARAWSKIYLEPIVRALFRTRLAALAPDAETRNKLRQFLRSRWFKPPFSGKRFIGWMLDACAAMTDGRSEKGSLLPDNHALDLFVSLTDFYGHNHEVRLHDPKRLVEREHRHIMQFSYLRDADGAYVSDFDSAMVPGLVFAARATASFPGAFPPMTIAEMDEVLAERRQPWPRRNEFIAQKFRALLRGGLDPENAVFIDGSTVNNKPFAAAIAALEGRPANREVVRRLIYVDPDPDPGDGAERAGQRPPGMFRTIVGAAVEIPGNEPVRGELERLDEINRKVRMLSRVVDMARPGINRHVADIISRAGDPQEDPLLRIARWRAEANELATTGAGFAFASYFNLKILRVIDGLGRLVAGLADRYGVANADDRLGDLLAAWAARQVPALSGGAQELASEDDISFLRAYDVDFRVRRIRFVIRRLNELYRVATKTDAALRSEELDEIKTNLYSLLDRVRQRWHVDYFAPEIANGAARALNDRDMDALMQAIGYDMDLQAADAACDSVFLFQMKQNIGPYARQELIGAYVSFAFFDTLSFPMLQWGDMDELEEVLIHRLSPEDSRSLREGDRPVALKGATLRHFGAFFNRSYREHDYLWGRLIAADRLVDIVLDSAPQAAVDINAAAFKDKLLHAILDAETPFLNHDPSLISGIRKSQLHAKTRVPQAAVA